MNRYTVIDHKLREKLGLDLNEYCIADAAFPGNAGMPEIGDYVGIENDSMALIVKSLVEKDILRIDNNGFLWPTDRYKQAYLNSKFPGKNN